MDRDDQCRLSRQMKPLEGMRKVIAQRMTFSMRVSPQGTGQMRLEVGKRYAFAGYC